MFNGYLAFSGTEVFNLARVTAYLQNHLPTLAPPVAMECDGLAEALGDGDYSSPMQDEAPWFSAYRTESQGFYGLAGLALDGFEDSTLTTPVVEVTGDGAAFGRPRRTSKTLRLRALAVAADEKAMDYGLAWLRDVLAGSPCTDGNCSGDTLCFLTGCPSPCDWSTAPDVILSEDYATSVDLPAALLAWGRPVGDVTSTLGSPTLHWPEPVSLSRELADLVPGTAYRVNVGITSPGTVTLSVPGAIGGLVADRVPHTGVLADPTTGGVGTFTFRATSSTHRLVITSDTELTMTGADVRRTSPSLVAIASQPDTHPDEAFAWSQDWAAASTNYVGVVSGATWFFKAAAGTVAVADGAIGVRRRITGLVPGKEYMITAAVNAETSAGATTGAVLSVVGQTDVASGATDTISSTVKGGWLTLRFTASAASHIVRLAPSGALSLNTSGIKLGVNYLRVEEAAPLVVDPDDAENEWRYYRNVSVQRGLQVVRQYPTVDAVLREVDVIFTAGNPQPVGAEVLVSSSLGAGVAITLDVACSNGAAVRTNLAVNPSFEVNATNSFTLTSGSTVVLERVADATAPEGGFILRLRSTGTGASSKTITYGPRAVTPGLPNAFSFAWTSSLTNAAITVTARAYRSSPDSSLISTTTVATATVRQPLTWERLGFVYTPPPGAANVYYDVAVSATWTNGGYTAFDRVLDENSPVVLTYFDGNSPDAAWNATAGLSQSTYTKSSTSAVFDPDCPPPPPAPRPPVIVDLCAVGADVWVRHAIDVPAQFTSLSPKVVPVTSLTTGSTDARGVRVRVYANPFGRSAAELDQCSYCGEFLLSYMPANSTLTVDAASREVTVTTGGRTVNALNLLYGSDGGPMTWPEMDCGIPYIVTVDLDAVTSPLVNLALSVVPVF